MSVGRSPIYVTPEQARALYSILAPIRDRINRDRNKPKPVSQHT